MCVYSERRIMDERREVRIFDEVALERKLRREKTGPLMDETARFSAPDDLIHGQLLDLIEGLPESPRSKEVLQLRLEGWTLREIAGHMGVSRQRIERIWQRLGRRLPPNLTEMEAKMVPGHIPHYGWQEVFLDSTRGK